MIKQKIAEVLNERIRIAEETQDNWTDGIEQCWKKCIEIFVADVNRSIEYFLHVCNDEEFYWLSEVFEEIIKNTQHRDFIVVWRCRLANVKPETYCQQDFKSEHMRQWIDYAEYVRSISMDIDYAEDRMSD